MKRKRPKREAKRELKTSDPAWTEWNLADVAFPKTAGRSRVKKIWKSREHLDRVKAEPCLLANGLPNHGFWLVCDGPMDPHHCRKLKPAGLTARLDALAVPLCRKHHKMMDGDERTIWKLHEVDPRDFIRSFSKEGAAALAALEQQK